MLKKVEADTVSILANNKIKNKHTGSRSWTIPNRIGPKNCMLRYILIKLLKFYLKALKAASEKGRLTYRGKNNKNENRTLSRNPEGQEKVAQHLLNPERKTNKQKYPSEMRGESKHSQIEEN